MKMAVKRMNSCIRARGMVMIYEIAGMDYDQDKRNPEKDLDAR